MFSSVLQGPPFVFSVEPATDGNGFAVVIPIATCSATYRQVAIACELVEMTVFGEIYWDFSYAVRVISLDGSYESFQTQERVVAAPYVPADARRFAMAAVCDALRLLIDQVNPRQVYWVMKERDPDEYALRRYQRLRETMENQGYIALDEGTDAYGRRFLTMGRKRN